MSSSESPGRKDPESESLGSGPELPESPNSIKKDRIIGLSIIAAAFLFALGTSRYSAEKIEAAEQPASAGDRPEADLTE